MFETLFNSQLVVARHRSGPFALERERYLHHGTTVGATDSTQRHRAHILLRFARKMSPGDREGVDAQRLEDIIGAISPSPTPKCALTMVTIARPWLKYLGWWYEPQRPEAFVDQLQEFVRWMRDERGLAPCTIEQWRDRVATFLLWCRQTGRSLATLEPEDIDAYFVTYGAGRWSRVSARYVATMLRVFLRHAADSGLCQARLADSILSPRHYRLQTLPYAPGWDDVQRLISTAASDSEADLRDRAIMLLLAVYGLRSGEVVALRLDDIDFDRQQLRIWRLKRRQPQTYPLVASVAQALHEYIDTARPAVEHAQVFIRVQAPRIPISRRAIYDIVARRFEGLDVTLAHHGPHALRHACASKMLAEGLMLKEIGDHLGHLSAESTAIYTKVDLAALRQVGQFDLGGLQ